MKVNLVSVSSRDKKCVNKDLAGGMGSRTTIGDSPLAKIIEFVKFKNVKLPTISLAYLAAIFQEKGHEVHYFQDKCEDGDITFIPSSIVDYKNELRIAQNIKKNYKTKVGFYGPFASIKPELFLDVADFVVEGEVETIAQEIALTHKIPKGTVKSPLVKDLNTLPFPAWQYFPIQNYSYSPVITRKNFTTILSSRGCPYSCYHYCPYTLAQGRTWRARSVENIIAEMEYLYQNFNIRGLDFRDPNFAINKSRVIDLAKAMIDHGFNFRWSCETHLNLLDEPLIELLYKAGLRNINVGIESIDPEVIKTSKRQNSLINQQEKIIKFCHQIGVNIAAFYIIGFPSETEASAQRTIEYAQKLNTLIAQFTLCTPYPGTNFYEEMKNSITETDWQNFTANVPVFQHPNLTKRELLRLKEKAWTDYYFRPSYLYSFIQKYLRNVFDNWS